jgi:hypothetical protein
MNRSYSKIRHIQEVNMRLEKSLIKEQVDTSLDSRVNALIDKGYKVVDKISLPDGEYDLGSWVYTFYLNKDNKDTGFAYVGEDPSAGSLDKVNVVGGMIEGVKVYKMLYNQSLVGGPAQK